MEENEKTEQKSQISFGNLYDINKRFMCQLPKMDETQKSLQFGSIGGWLSSHVKEHYFMLICRERYDFTLFHLKQHNYSKCVKELEEVLDERGTIVDIEYNHDEDNYDIWVKNNEEAFMYKIFPYDIGVIEVV